MLALGFLAILAPGAPHASKTTCAEDATEPTKGSVSFKKKL